MSVAVAERYNLSYAANITGTVSTSEDRSRHNNVTAATLECFCHEKVLYFVNYSNVK